MNRWNTVTLAVLILLISALLMACSPVVVDPTEEPPDDSSGETPDEVADEPTKEPAEDVTEEPAAVTNSVETADQSLGAGTTVTIPAVSSDTAGWMVIHSENEGAPGPVLGYTAVTAGENTDVVVELSAKGLTGKLFAMLHVDAGVEGEYEFPGDDVPAKNADDKVVVKPFTVTGNAVTVEDQALENSTVTIDGVLSEGAGWLVIHAEADGAPGPILGRTAVEAGYTSGVVVEIDTENATEKMFAMLHVDAGTAGEFEFPGGDDVPARDADGNVVTPPFVVDLGMAEAADGAAVSITDSRFTSKEVKVKVGSTVTWTHDGNFPHTITADAGAFNSGTLGAGDAFSVTFDEPGTYAYYCEFHGSADGGGMSGTVIVEP